MYKSVTVVLLLLIIVNGEFLEDKHNDGNNLARKKKFKFPYYSLFYGFGFHTLAILYWIKVKVIIAIFIIGAAIFWGVRYIWNYKSCIHDASVISGPVATDHEHNIHHEIEPFSGYSLDSPPQTGIIIKDFGHYQHNNRKVWEEKQTFD